MLTNIMTCMYSVVVLLFHQKLPSLTSFFFFFFNDTATTEIYTLSLHDALPICAAGIHQTRPKATRCDPGVFEQGDGAEPADRKSTRLNSSHVRISYAVFCLKKKKIIEKRDIL